MIAVSDFGVCQRHSRPISPENEHLGGDSSLKCIKTHTLQYTVGLNVIVLFLVSKDTLNEGNSDSQQK